MALLSASGSAHAFTINTTETGKRIRWSSDTVALQLDPALEKWLPAGDAYAALEMGLEAWRGLPRVPDIVVKPGAPYPTPGQHGEHPTNGVYLLRHWPYAHTKLAITVVTYEMSTGRLLDADVLVNGETKFALLDEYSKSKTSDYDLAAVLTHETGHMLGLGESAADPGATMWPYAMPGETQKRTLSDDDERGVAENYLGAPPAAAVGCGALSVAGKAHGRGWLVFALGLFGAVPAWRRLRRAGRLARWLLPWSVLVLLCGFGQPHPLTVQTLAKHATREEVALAQELCSSPDENVARDAHVLLDQVLARAPRAALPASDPGSVTRITALFGDAPRATAVLGRARRLQTLEVDGLFFTHYSVNGSDGRSHQLLVPGGVRDGIGQRLLDGELPPADGAQLLVVPQSDGTQRWAYAEGDRIFGGHLGDGPAIEGVAGAL